MRFTLTVFCLIMIALPLAAGQPTVREGGEVFPAKAEINGKSVPFRGGHLLEWWSLDVYTAAFYAPMDTKTYDELLDAKTPRRIVLRYHRSIDAEDIEKATRKGIKKNSNVDRRALEERLKKLYACYADVEEGDEYRIDYDPEARETSIYFNGELSCTIEGEDFAAAFFAIWTSTYALDSEMSESLTGMKQ